jgi:hypothetical protein
LLRLVATAARCGGVWGRLVIALFLFQAGMDPEDDPGGDDEPSTSAAVITSTGIKLSAADQAALFDDEDDNDDVDLDALQQQVEAS